MRMLTYPWTVALGVAVVSTSAWGQIENGTCPLVTDQGDTLILTYDSGLLPTDGARPLDIACTVEAPCDDVTILVDTPLWRDEESDFNTFRDDIRGLVGITNDSNVFVGAPTIVFTNLGNDPTTTLGDYESIILQETTSSTSVIALDLPPH